MGLVRTFMALCTACSIAFGKDMILTTLDGQDLLLKDDNTWTYHGAKKAEFEKDFTVSVGGGKIVLVGMDGTWGYVKEEILDERELIPLDSVAGKGSFTHLDIAVATNKAQKAALDQIIARMRVALKKIKIDQKKFVECIKRVEKYVDKQESFKKGTGWTVSVSIVCDRGSILAVAECAMNEKNDTAVVKKKKTDNPAK